MLRVRGIRFQFPTGFYGFSYPASHTPAAIRCYCTEQTDATKINLMGYILCVTYSVDEKGHLHFSNLVLECNYKRLVCACISLKY